VALYFIFRGYQACNQPEAGASEPVEAEPAADEIAA
jgi:hypothetical protein